MASLDFVKTTIGKKEVYAVDFTADDACNVHFEREEGGAVVFQQRCTSSGEWATTRAFSSQAAPLCFDTNLVSDVYPMNWRIYSESPVTSGIKTDA